MSLGTEPGSSPVGPEIRLTDAPGASTEARLAWSNSSYGVVFSDARNGESQIFLTHVTPSGTKLADEFPVSCGSAPARMPDIAWTGETYGISWSELSDEAMEIYLRVL